MKIIFTGLESHFQLAYHGLVHFARRNFDDYEVAMQYSKCVIAAGCAASVFAISPSVFADDGDEPVVVDAEEEEEADEEKQDDEIELVPPRLREVEVIGERSEELESVPGSATVVDEERIRSQSPISANEVLRTVPGVHVREEEGMGLRPNIGIRGLDPSRGRTLLVLEDGAPITLAPYGEPELYYAPAIDRVERIELVKGSGSVLFGPQTIGGVLNYITHQPPEDLTINGEVRGGNFGYLHGQASVGDTIGDFGYRLGVMHQRFTGPRNLNMDFTDVTGRVNYEFSPRSNLSTKLHYYDEFSNATYLGLTTPQFENNPRDNFAVNDELAVRRIGLSTTYNQLVGDSALVQTTAYGYYTTRPWNRQDFDRRDEGADYDRIIDGQGNDIADSEERPADGSAIYFRDTMQERDRAFYVAGVEPRATIDHALGGIDNELIVGTRIHGELAEEQRPITSITDPDFELIRDDETRRGFAIAGYGQNRAMFLDGDLQVSPGLRVESFWNEREIRRSRVDGEPTDHDPPRENRDHVVALIPGAGLSYALTDEYTAFAGVHRGFAPPRTKDAVTTDGELLELDAEYSINYEAGVRANIDDWLGGEVSGFVLDFSNQIIPPAEAAGATDPGDGDLVNAGETRHLGVETDVSVDLGRRADLGFALPVGVAYTWVHAEFGDAWEEELVGNRIPYAPEHRLSSRIQFEHPLGIGGRIDGYYVSKQYTDPQNTEEGPLDGLSGAIEPHFLLDARIGYTHQPWGATFFVAGKNLTDESYIVSRAPRGIQPGTPRQVFAGVSGTFTPGTGE